MKMHFFSLALGLVSCAWAQIPANTLLLGGSIRLTNQSTEQERTGYTGSITNGNVKSPVTQNLSITPTIGFFVANGLAAGVFANMGTSSSTSRYVLNQTTGNTFIQTPGYVLGSADKLYDLKTKTKTSGGGLFARRYAPLSGKFYWTYGATLGLTKQTGTRTNTYLPTGSALYTTRERDDSESRTYGVSGDLGIAFMAGKHWLFQASLGNLINLSNTQNKTYTYNQTQPDAKSTTTSKSTTFQIGNGGSLLSSISIGINFLLNTSGEK